MTLPTDKRLLVLSYRRSQELVEDEHPLSGSIAFFDPPNSTGGTVHVFENITYRRMISIMHEEVKKHSEDTLIGIRRTDANLPVLVLTEEEARLLRMDVVAYIRKNVLPKKSRRIVLKEGDPHLMRAGFNTMADAFGEEVFLSIKREKVECPVTGRWVHIDASIIPVTVVNMRTTFGWATIKVQDLLGLKKDRYYLPRFWNRPNAWISHADLKQKLDTFRKEKAEAEEKS